MKFGGLLNAYFAIERPAVPIPEPSRFVCGVPDCRDGKVTLADEVATVVECDTHNTRTTHDTTEREVRTQQVIRVQDQWRQHGTAPPRK